MKKFYLFLLLAFINISANAVTKTWALAGNGSWNTPANWSPSGVPGVADDVVFANSAAVTVTLDFTTSTTINSISINGTANVTFLTGANRTINLGGGGTSGTALFIVASRNFVLNASASNVGTIINIPTNYTASINGGLNLDAFATSGFTGQTHKLITVDANSVQVNSGGVIITYAENSGEPFGSYTGTNNIVVFNSGARFTYYAGANPFGSSSGEGISQFKSGSIYSCFGGNTLSMAGRTYSTLVIGSGGTYNSSTNTSNITTTVDSLIVNTGTLNLSASGNASPSFSFNNVNLGLTGTGTNVLTLGSDVTVSTPTTYTISGNLLLGNNSTATNSTLNLGQNSGTGSSETRITFTGIGKSLDIGTTGTRNINQSDVSGATYSTKYNIAPNASFSFNRNLNLATANTNSTMTIQSLGVIAVGTGATLTANGKLTIQSNSTGTGSIANSAGSISGNVTVERYIPGGRRTSRFLGHPFSNALDMSSLIDDIYVTGSGAGFDVTTTNSPSAFWFSNPSTWTAFTSTSDASWSQYRGIRVLVRGDRTQANSLTGVAYTPNAVTLDLTGTLNTSAQNIVLPAGYSVVSNPYPSPVNVGARLNATTNIGTQFWFWDANAGPTAGAYRTKVIGSAATIPMNGAFIVEPTAPTTINFVEGDKVATDSSNLFRTSNSASGLVELQVLYNNYPADYLYVRFNNSANDQKDALDGVKLTNPEVNFYALSADNQKLSLDTRVFNNNKIIPLGFTATAANTFTIKAADLGITEEVYLKDKLLNVETKLDATTTYTFSVDPANPATVGENRFELVFRTSAALPTTFVNVAAQQKASAIEVTFNTANETNMHSYEVEESKDGSSFTKGTTLEAKNAATNTYTWLDVTTNNGNNYYIVKAIEKNGVVKYSQVVRVNIGTKRSEFTVYPNPVKGGTINLQLTDIEKGVYTVKVVNNLGQEIAAKQIIHNGGSANQTISIGNVPTGKYNMVITNGTTSVTKTVIVE